MTGLAVLFAGFGVRFSSCLHTPAESNAFKIITHILSKRSLKTMPVAPTIKLNNGKSFPVIGLGTYLSDPGAVTEAVKIAIDTGYRHFDCAYFYENEKEVGEGIRAKIDDGTVTREELFVTSKLWNTFHSKELVVPTCKKTLKNLGLDYLDLYLVHWPFGMREGGDLSPRDKDGNLEGTDVDYIETWKGMEECVTLDLTKSIGISNFNSEQIERLLSVAKVKPVTNQVECNPNINQKKLIEFCKARDITVTAYCPLGQPISDKKKSSSAPPPPIKNEKIIEIAKKHSKTAAQVVLRYLVQIGTVPIPKSVTKSRIIENFNIFDFELSKDDLAEIDKINSGFRICPFNDLKGHKYYPFDIDF